VKFWVCFLLRSWDSSNQEEEELGRPGKVSFVELKLPLFFCGYHGLTSGGAYRGDSPHPRFVAIAQRVTV
jgi:hypothetical protein